MTAIDLHQHLWPDELLDRLRARSRPPYLRGWTLFTRSEPPYDLRRRDHDVDERVRADEEAGVSLACVSLSAPLGIESLPRPEAVGLLDAWHAGARALPEHFAAWASVPAVEPDLDLLAALLRDGFAGLQLPATDLLGPAAWMRAAKVLKVAEEAGRPVLVHPGPVIVRPLVGQLPEWWAPVVSYTAQLQAAWWGWHAVRGRALFPRLRLVFAAGAGLAPLQQERYAARGGPATPADPLVWVDTSSHGRQALDALTGALGVDALVLGSDAPYADRSTPVSGQEAVRAIREDNPARVLGSVPARAEEVAAWRSAS